MILKIYIPLLQDVRSSIKDDVVYHKEDEIIINHFSNIPSRIKCIETS